MYQMWRWKIGSVSCTQCDKWSFINIKDDWECIIFKVGYFSDILGITFCKKCPEEMKSSLDFIYIRKWNYKLHRNSNWN